MILLPFPCSSTTSMQCLSSDKCSEFGLNYYHYGARIFDPLIARFVSIDPIADEFAWVSPYNYAENSPIANIDLHGLQKVSINDIKDTSGKVVSRNVNVSVSMKVLNLSSKDNFHFNDMITSAGANAKRSFNTSFKSKIVADNSGLTDYEVPVNVSFNLNARMVNNLSQVKDTDIVTMIADDIDAERNSNAEGIAQTPGNIMMLEGDQSDSGGHIHEVLLHELGHNLGISFGYKKPHSPDGKGLMGANINGSVEIPKNILRDLYIGIGAAGLVDININHRNTKENAKNFFNENTKKHDKSKASKAGL